MNAALRYEVRMQLRRPALWTVTAATVALLWLLIAPALPTILDEDARTAMVRITIAANVALPIGFAFLLADRLVRDDRLGVSSVLDATAASRPGRLIGKYLATVGASALPITLTYLGFATIYALRNAAPQAFGWAVAMLATITAPALLMVGALAICVPVVMPTTTFRILFVGYWIWSSYLVPPQVVPTLAQTVLAPMGGYPIDVFFHYHGPHAGRSSNWAGPVPGAAFNVLRPVPTQATAWLSIGLLLGLAALTLCAAHLLRARRT